MHINLCIINYLDIIDILSNIFKFLDDLSNCPEFFSTDIFLILKNISKYFYENVSIKLNFIVIIQFSRILIHQIRTVTSYQPMFCSKNKKSKQIYIDYLLSKSNLWYGLIFILFLFGLYYHILEYSQIIQKYLRMWQQISNQKRKK